MHKTVTQLAKPTRINISVPMTITTIIHKDSVYVGVSAITTISIKQASSFRQPSIVQLLMQWEPFQMQAHAHSREQKLGLLHSIQSGNSQRSPEYPGGQMHVKDPIVFKQVPLIQGSTDDTMHSLMSMPHRESVNPGWQEHVNEPNVFWHSPLFMHGDISLAHSSMSESHNFPE